MTTDHFRTGLLLGLFTLIATALVTLLYEATEPRISANQQAVKLRLLNQLIPPQRYDNDLVNDTITVPGQPRFGHPKRVALYRARLAGRPVAAIIEATAEDGYNGAIRLLVALWVDATVAAVRVISHQETPGLGDRIEARRSDWIDQFAGRSLHNPDRAMWGVKRDGGYFDQLSGATITARAVVRTVAETVDYFEQNRTMIMAKNPPADE